jgi:hypothetical protein
MPNIPLSQAQAEAVTATISSTRLATYITASSPRGIDPLHLYAWNAQVAASFLQSLQICEVAVRNGIAGVIERRYGANWPWDHNFERNLPTTAGRLKPKEELIQVRNKMQHGYTGKVIAELKLAFWCHMLTSRHDRRLWTPYLRDEFPHAPANKSVPECRQEMHDSLERLRLLRNRIAHHEPIFARPLPRHHHDLKQLIAWRCRETLAWHMQWETVTRDLAVKP